MHAELRAKSSSSEATCSVQFLIEDGKLTVFCNCSAGEFGKLCKHKVSFLAGERSLLAELPTEGAFEEVQAWVDNSILRELTDRLLAAEKSLTKAQSEMAVAKKSIEKALKQGVAIVEIGKEREK